MCIRGSVSSIAFRCCGTATAARVADVVLEGAVLGSRGPGSMLTTLKCLDLGFGDTSPRTNLDNTLFDC